MRIISGTARGTKLYTLEGSQTRPTLDRVKESIFNIIQDDVRDSVFLDLFSGSGAMGLEAASRGAKKSILCDKAIEANNIIKKNIEKTHLEDKVELYRLDFKVLLKEKINDKLGIIYIDPPYDSNYIKQALQIIMNMKQVDNNTLIIIETDRKEVIDQIEQMEVQIEDKRKYGRAEIIFLRIGKE